MFKLNKITIQKINENIMIFLLILLVIKQLLHIVKILAKMYYVTGGSTIVMKAVKIMCSLL